MKLKKLLRNCILISVLLLSFTIYNCKKDESIKEKETEEIVVDDPNMNSEFIIESDDVKRIDNTIKFNGVFYIKYPDGSKFKLIEGDIEIETDDNGDVINIGGSGDVYFPDIGTYGEILKNFTWKKVKSHIEYKTGKEYKDDGKANDFPLSDDSYYFHFSVFDNDETYAFQSIGNAIVYNFVDFYLDPNDPSMFFKVSLYTPGKGSDGSAGKKLMARILDKAKLVGKELKEFGGSPKLLIGLSNTGKIMSKPHEFDNSERFDSLYSGAAFESLPSHVFYKIENFPIPQTYVLRLSGEKFISVPFQAVPSIGDRESAVANWLNQDPVDLIGPISESFNGKIDMGGFGIGLVLGALPNFDILFDTDIFNAEPINLDLIGATYVDKYSEKESVFQFGGQSRTPIISDIFGEKIKNLIETNVPSNYTNEFIYLSVGTNVDDWSLYLESKFRYHFQGIPLTSIEVEDNFLYVNQNQISTYGTFNKTIGFLTFDGSFEGEIKKDEGFFMRTTLSRDITLPGDIVLSNVNLKTELSSKDGISFEGQVDLPFGFVEAESAGTFDGETFTLGGEISRSIRIPNTDFEIDFSNLKYSLSNDPNIGIEITGYANVPHGIGSVYISGWLNKEGFYLKGDIKSSINFNEVVLSSSNAELIISSKNGVKIKGDFVLPGGLKSASLEGYITKNAISLSGKMANTIRIGNYNFTFSNSSIKASTTDGVKITGNIDLYKFKVGVSGSINPNNTFKLTGKTNLSTGIVETSVNVTVTNTKINMTGNGCIKVAFIDHCGSLTFIPDWGAKTIQICRGNVCIKLK